MNGYEAKHKKATDNVKLVRKIAAIAMGALIALCCYCVTVYAWFQADIVNTGNAIKAGAYFPKVELLDGEGKTLWESQLTDLDQTFDLDGAEASYVDVAQIRVSNIGEEGKALAFRYQVELTADGVRVASAIPTPDDPRELEPGDAAAIVEVAAIENDAQELRLQFHTAFKESGAIATLETGASSTTAAAPTVGTETTTSASAAQAAVQAAPAGEEVTSTTAQTTAAASSTASAQSEPSLSEGEAEPTEVLPASTESTSAQSDTTQSASSTTLGTQSSETQTAPAVSTEP